MPEPRWNGKNGSVLTWFSIPFSPASECDPCKPDNEKKQSYELNDCARFFYLFIRVGHRIKHQSYYYAEQPDDVRDRFHPSFFVATAIETWTAVRASTTGGVSITAVKFPSESDHA
jgi:hypothetical protein